ncbi:hypothetical protein VTO73DRAFT_11134 [Trametes versicolor]
MAASTSKTSAYAKRNDASSAVPLEEDSDSDFNPGSFVPEPKLKRGRNSKAPRKSDELSDSPRPSKRRRSETLAKIGGRGSQGINEKRAGAVPPRPNLLLQYFGDLGIKPVPESDDDPADADEEEEDDDDEKEEDDEEPEIPPPMPKTLAMLYDKAKLKKSTAGAHDDSDTEYEESEPEDGPPPTQPLLVKRTATGNPTAARPSPSKKPRLDVTDDSATEIEDEDAEPHWILSAPAPSAPKKPKPAYDSDADTEEEESDLESSAEDVQVRPVFPLKEGQTRAEPLALDKAHKVPGSINTFLREYQRDGVRFFWERYNEGRGGLLGDDMGLKSKEWKANRTLPPANADWPTCLIIAPSSVVGNWEREFETWGYFEVGMYIGPPTARASVLTDFKLGRLDVLVTSFEVARIDIDLIDELPWSCIFIDEVHRVKNPRSKLAEAFSRFTCPRRFGLSGTVIQNGYEELWTVLDWTNPGSVGTKKQWETYVEKPLRVGQSKSATDEEHVQAALVAKLLTEKLLPHLFLRRTKQIIQDQLPQKTDQVVFCPLTPVQIAVYKRILDLEAVANLVHKDKACDCGSKKARKKCCHPVHPGDLFKYMSTLIKIANHLALILPAPTDTIDQTARNRELSRLAFPTGALPKYGPSMLRPEYCGKWQVLETLLKGWKREGGNKVLIFTKSVKLLEMLEFHLNSRNYGFVKLDGSTKQPDRMPMIDRFQEDPAIFVFLISTMAGGTGLNLTAANKVVVFDPNWNPAHDLQAMDRAYRFGQTRDVAVYRLLGAGSIEELIYARQVYKQQQMQVGYNASLQTRYFEGVQGDKHKQGELFGIQNIFKLHEHTLATKMAIERAHVSDLDWAFAYMGGKNGVVKRPQAKAKKAGVHWVYEEEAKTGKDYDEFRGLGALLFDDAPPELDHKPDDIEKTLNAIGVHYTHRNDDLIAPSAIEGQRMQVMLQERKKKAKQAKERRDSGKKGKDKTPEPEWPPRRKHHKAPPSPRSKLQIRQRALIEQGLLKDPEDLPKFAQEFAQKTLEEQTAFLAQLDDYAKKHFQ